MEVETYRFFVTCNLVNGSSSTYITTVMHLMLIGPVGMEM